MITAIAVHLLKGHAAPHECFRPNQFALLKTRRFLPLFVTQALSAFNDNAFRFAVASILITTLPQGSGGHAQHVVGCPFRAAVLLFSATGGQLADKFDKAFWRGESNSSKSASSCFRPMHCFRAVIWLKQFCIFLAGLQAAFFGPIKYSILPQHLKKEELLGGNGMVEMATFLAVLRGTIFGNLIVTHEQGKWAITVLMIAVALFSYWTARQIPDAPPPLARSQNQFQYLHLETWNAMKLAREKDVVFQAIMGDFMVLAFGRCVCDADAAVHQ